jgi:hypothetical protein
MDRQPSAQNEFAARALQAGTPRYQRHKPEESSLYPIVETHLPAFSAGLAAGDSNLPSFVLQEFCDYLRCGRLEHGFIRAKCDGCRHELLVWRGKRIRTPKKPKQPGRVSCNRRATENQECADGVEVRQAFATRIGRSLGEVPCAAKKATKQKLGAQAKHDSCVCIDSRGVIRRTKGG